MIPSFPEDLPCALKDGYGIGHINKIRSTEMDAGRAVQRWEFEDAPIFPAVSWIFSMEEARLFDAWVSQVAKAGWFDITLLTPMGYEPVTARFNESPKRAQLIGKFSWKYEATLEIEFEPMLEEGWAEIAPDYVLQADIFDRAINLNWPLSPYQTDMSVFDRGVNEQWPLYAQ